MNEWIQMSTNNGNDDGVDNNNYNSNTMYCDQFSSVMVYFRKDMMGSQWLKYSCLQQQKQ